MRFSKRTQWDTGDSELTKAHRERLAAGLPVADLTASNPTRCGFTYPQDLLAALTDPAAFDYDPNPNGSLTAREAVCRYYAAHGAEVKVSQLLLTTSTSEAYGYLFKLLCDPGDAILVPQPSYPLFDFLADLEVIQLHSTPLIYDHGWQLDLEGLRQGITSKTRAVMLVHPNNPTGHFTTQDEARELAAICREHGLALIVDEVFLDYALDGPGAGLPENRASFISRDLDILVFIVSGISKICGLPQMKAAWLAAVGPGHGEAMARLEVISDTFLSMNAPIQRALPAWLSGRDGIQNQIRERVRLNLAEVDRALAVQPDELLLVNRLIVQGGWYAVLRIPAIRDDEQTARELLERGVWVHPGYFFGMGRSGWLVVSLLGEVEEFRRGIGLLLGYVRWNHKRNLTG